MPFFQFVCLSLAFYGLGSILPAAMLYRIVTNADIFQSGSGNPGFMNIMKLAGWPYAVITLVIDVGKGFLAIDMAFSQHHNLSYAVGLGTFVVMGHCFSIIYGFRGGKGVAASIGVLLGSMLYLGFWGPFITLLVGAVTFLIYYWVTRDQICKRQEFSITMMIAAVFAIIQFSSVGKLVHGEVFVLGTVVIATTWLRAKRVKPDGIEL